MLPPEKTDDQISNVDFSKIQSTKELYRIMSHSDGESIRTNDVYEVVEIVVRHIERYGRVVMEKLRDELCR